MASDIPKELIVPVKGLVTYVRGKNITTSHTPQSEMMVGGPSPSYPTGYRSSLEIGIENYDRPLLK